MRRNVDSFTYTTLLLLLGVVALIGACLSELVDIKNILQKQFDYQSEMQFCRQAAMEYPASCKLEMDTDGSVHWYFNASEGSM